MPETPSLDEHTEAALQPRCQAVIVVNAAQIRPDGYLVQGTLSIPCPDVASWIARDQIHDDVEPRLICNTHADAHRRVNADYVICTGCGQRYQSVLEALNAPLPNKPNT